MSLGRLYFLAHLLLPSQHGVAGIATLVMAFLELATELGINVFLIQEKDKIDKYLNTAWVLSIVRGIGISLILVLAARPIATFFNSPESYNLILLASLVPFIRSFQNPAIVRFQKDLEFNKEFLLRTSNFFIDAGITIVVAFATQSAASIIWGLIAGSIFELIVSFLFVRPLPKLKVNLDQLKAMFHRGKWLTFAGTFDYVFQNADDVVVGKILNVTSLGIYQKAYDIATLPITGTNQIVSKVTFPVFAKFAEDKKRLLTAYLKSLVFVSFTVLIVSFLVFIFSEQIVLLILGPNWLEAASVLRVLALFGFVKSVSNTSFPLFLSLKKQNYITMTTFVEIGVLMLTIFPLVQNYGITGAGISALIASCVALPIVFALVYKELHD